jgi:hypothetical protein
MTKELLKQALEALLSVKNHGWDEDTHTGRALITALKAALEQPPLPVQPEPVKLRRGDTLRCIETDELCTVWATSTTNKTLIKWSANNFGNYTAEQIGELFWIEPQQAEPVTWDRPSASFNEWWDVDYEDPANPFEKDSHGYWAWAGWKAALEQRPWVGLTDDEIKTTWSQLYCDVNHMKFAPEDRPQKETVGFLFARAIEAKLKERNT